MTKTLEEQVEERKKQAERREISHKAYMVAKYLGKPSEGRIFGTSEPYVYRFHDTHASIIIVRDSRRDVLDITYRLDQVFREEVRIISYKPGNWERKLNVLYARALENKTLREAQQQASDKKAQKKKEADLR